jgi:phage-related minor tail protein
VAIDALQDILAAQTQAAQGASSGGGGLFGGIGNILSGLFGSLFGGGSPTPFADAAAAAGIISPFEHGGRFAANQPILVGEAGPELLVPPMAGEIVPNHALGERVDVLTPAQQGALAGTAPQQAVNQKFVINISPGVPEAVRAHFAAAMSIPLDHSARIAVG